MHAEPRDYLLGRMLVNVIIIITIIIIHSFYIALFSALEQNSPRTCRMWFWTSDCILLRTVSVEAEKTKEHHSLRSRSTCLTWRTRTRTVSSGRGSTIPTLTWPSTVWDWEPAPAPTTSWLSTTWDFEPVRTSVLRPLPLTGVQGSGVLVYEEQIACPWIVLIF